LHAWQAKTQAQVLARRAAHRATSSAHFYILLREVNGEILLDSLRHFCRAYADQIPDGRLDPDVREWLRSSAAKSDDRGAMMGEVSMRRAEAQGSMVWTALAGARGMLGGAEN